MLSKKFFVKLFFVLVIAAIALFAPLLAAHEEDAEVHLSLARLNPGEELQQPMLYAFLIVLLLGIASALLGERLGEGGKKAMFWAIAMVAVGATVYLAGSIVLLFWNSSSSGPVHWHADFEVWACGERILLRKSAGWTTRVGPILFHHHGDERLHVEGVILRREDVALGKFFAAIGGKFALGELAVIDEGGVVREWKNGGLCPDGRPGKLKLFVNGVENDELSDYVISPFTDVPPGDVLKIVFGPE